LDSRDEEEARNLNNPNPAMGTEQTVQVLDSLADSKNNPITCQGIGGIRAEGEEGVGVG